MGRQTQRSATIDFNEFLRFGLTGVTATTANLIVVWACRYILQYQYALFPGIVAASATSFLMSKFFAFRARDWSRSGGEAARFLLVYVTGATIYWAVSVTAGAVILPRFMAASWAETLGVLMGAGVMTFTSYFGHRFYTYGHAIGVRAR